MLLLSRQYFFLWYKVSFQFTMWQRCPWRLLFAYSCHCFCSRCLSGLCVGVLSPIVCLQNTITSNCLSLIYIFLFSCILFCPPAVQIPIRLILSLLTLIPCWRYGLSSSRWLLWCPVFFYSTLRHIQLLILWPLFSSRAYMWSCILFFCRAFVVILRCWTAS